MNSLIIIILVPKKKTENTFRKKTQEQLTWNRVLWLVDAYGIPTYSKYDPSSLTLPLNFPCSISTRGAGWSIKFRANNVNRTRFFAFFIVNTHSILLNLNCCYRVQHDIKRYAIFIDKTFDIECCNCLTFFELGFDINFVNYYSVTSK